MSDTEVTEIYKSPKADLLTEQEKTDDYQFFSVSLKKLCIMYIATMGMYVLVFFYQHWKAQKTKYGLKINPALRAIFSIFFVHSLFSKMKNEAENKGINQDIAFSMLATTYILCSIGSWVASNVPDTGILFAIGYAASISLTLIALYPLYRVQKVANIINNDENGFSNSNFTGYNWLFLVIGSLLWVISVFGVYISVALPELQ